MTRAIEPASAQYARELTDRIKHSTEQLYSLLLEAWESEAWRHLGYRSWSAYIGGEFDFTRNYAYRLIQQGQVVKALKEGVRDVLPMGNTREAIHITEREAREIAPLVPEVLDRVREQVAQGVEPQRAVSAAVAEVRAPLRRERFEDGYELREEPVHVHVCAECGEVWS